MVFPFKCLICGREWVTNPLNLLIQQQLNANCQDLEASLIRIKHLKEKYS